MMLRPLLLSFMVLFLVTSVALADEAELILRVDKSVGGEALSSAGLLYLAELGDTYLVLADEPGRERLSEAGIGFTEITKVYPGHDVFLLKPRSFRDEVLYSEVLIDLGQGHYLTTVETHEIEDLRFLGFSKIRLFARAFPKREKPLLTQSAFAITQDAHIVNLVANVSGDTLWKYISQLSGREPVVINGQLDTLITRYSYSWRIDHAADYLKERFQDYGVDVGFHEYVVGKYAFYSTSFVDSLNGWVVGSDQRVFRTRDGGLSWVRQKPGASFQSLWGVCFLDTLKGWIVGTSGTIRYTADGGQTWAAQTSPIGQTLREVTFLDSLTGWVVGYGGVIIRTTDGGQTWTSVPSGTGSDLYGLHFEAADRGWACGRDGVIQFWDGASWTAQTSGTSEYLLDVHFADDNIGWIVGGSRTVLKTADGGLNWIPQSAPSEANPFLKGVCFVDTLEGWIVGLTGTVIHTADGGSTWELQQTGTLFGLRWVRFVSASEGWAVGYGCTILHTADGGATWESQRENLPSGALLAWKNVVGTKPGTSSQEQVVICGHFDATSEDPNNLAPGADDNASGTAAVVEGARILADYPFERTIKFLCFSGEEQGLFGSGEYAGDAKAAGDSIVGVLNFDMIGYVNPAPEDIDLIGDYPSEWLVDFTVDCAAAYVPTLLTRKVINPDDVYSDHASFWSAGYHALLGIEDENLTYPYYHTTGDTLGNLTQSFATDVVRMGVAAVAELARPDTTTSVAGPSEEIAVLAAHPNPFSASTTISFALNTGSRVRIAVFDTQGRMVDRLLDHVLPAGRHEVTWNGTGRGREGVSPGIYFIRVDTGRKTTATKIIALR